MILFLLVLLSPLLNGVVLSRFKGGSLFEVIPFGGILLAAILAPVTIVGLKAAASALARR